jgi:hypothetical protein
MVDAMVRADDKTFFLVGTTGPVLGGSGVPSAMDHRYDGCHVSPFSSSSCHRPAFNPLRHPAQSGGQIPLCSGILSAGHCPLQSL